MENGAVRGSADNNGKRRAARIGRHIAPVICDESDHACSGESLSVGRDNHLATSTHAELCEPSLLDFDLSLFSRREAVW